MIDWTDDIFNIERLIRAVAKPSTGALFFVNNKDKIIIHRANIFDFQDFGFDDVCSGEIVAVYKNGKFLIKSFGGLLLAYEYETHVKIRVGDKLSNGQHSKNFFPFNQHGFRGHRITITKKIYNWFI